MLLRFQGGQTWLTKQDVAARYVEKHRYNADHWSEISELMQMDQGPDVEPDGLPSHILELAKHEAIEKRGMYASCVMLFISSTQYTHWSFSLLRP